MPVQPPQLPTFEKSRYATGPWGGLFASFFDLLQPFLKATVDTLRQGVPVQAFMDIEVLDGQSYPMRPMASPLPPNYTTRGVTVAGVFDPGTPGKSVGLTGGVTVEWANGEGGALVVLDVKGLPTGRTLTVRVLVTAE